MHFRFVILLVVFLFNFTCDIHSHIMPYETATAKYFKKYQIENFDSGLARIDCIYVINLDKRIEKWERMQSILSALNLNGNRVSGVHGWELTQEQMQEMAGPYPIRLRGGQYGCLLSHLSVLADAYERDFEVIWIMEDDIVFEEDVGQIPRYIEKLYNLDSDWDVFFTDPDSKKSNGDCLLSLTGDFRPDQEKLPRVCYLYRNFVAEDIMRLRQRYGTYSMIISKKGIRKILDYFTHVYMWSPIDVDMHYVPDIKEYCVTRDIVSVHIDGAPSDTAEHKNLWRLEKKSGLGHGLGLGLDP